jgi:glutamyl-tRNA synthetase
MSSVRVRFAPSPTGYLHIGSARTALFNWLYARNQDGQFILRIEDTDKERSEDKYLDEILSSLKWLGLGWDEEVYRQSKRFDMYKSSAETLISNGKAYYEETDKGKAVRLRIPKDYVITFYDIVRDKIEVNSDTLDDLVLLKSDGSPTYNFACVVDDADMKITHIIRGDDHIANTPKQLLIYQALEIKPPKFAHIPLILGEDKSRMSKRHGATSITEYKNKGYFPEAIVNFISLMGWSPKDNREKLSIQQITRLFSLKAVVKTGAVFNIQKLNWLNGEYIREKPLSELTDFLAGHLISRNIIKEDYNRQWLEAVVKSFQTRFCNIDEFIGKSAFLFNEEVVFDEKARQDFLSSKGNIENIKILRQALSGLNNFTPAPIEAAVKELSAKLCIRPADIIHPARVALTGASAAPGIYEVIYLIGKERVLKRLDAVCLCEGAPKGRPRQS